MGRYFDQEESSVWGFGSREIAAVSISEQNVWPTRMALNALTSTGARKSENLLKYVAKNLSGPGRLWVFRDFIVSKTSSVLIDFSRFLHCRDKRGDKVVVERRDSAWVQ